MKTISYILASALVCLSLTVYSQGVRQNSVFSGLSLGLSGGYQRWEADIIQDSREGSPNLSFLAEYGLSEHWGVYARWGAANTTPNESRELFFQLDAHKYRQREVQGGIFYALGSSRSQWRHTFSLSGVYLRTETELKSRFDQSIQTITFDGFGGALGTEVRYFFRTFLSIGLGLDIAIGRYTSAEYFGLRYNEDLAYRKYQANLGVKYHFNGR